MPERDRVQVVTSNGTIVEVSSADRAAIIAELRRWEESSPEVSHYLVLDAFERAGESGRVNLDGRQEANPIDTFRALAKRVGGESNLDPGVAKLNRTLVKEVHARWAGEEASSGSRTASILLLLGLVWMARSLSSRLRRV